MPRSDPPRRSPFSVIGPLVLFISAYQLLETMLSPAFPLIRSQLHASPADATWIFTGFLLSAAVFTPLVGRLADLYDKRRVLFGVVAVVCTGALISALASSIWVLVLGQVLQGVGIGILPLAVAIFRATLPLDRATAGNGLLMGVVALASVVGLLVAGPITSALSYHWLYWLTLIVLLSAAAWAWFTIPSAPGVPGGRVDWLGAALLASGLALLLYTVTEAPGWGWANARTLALFAVSALILACWVSVALRRPNPIVDLGVLAGRSVTGVCLIALVVGFGSFGISTALPLMLSLPKALGYGMGASISQIGLYLLPIGVAGTIAAPLVRPVSDRIGRRPVMVLGTVLIVLGSASLAVMHTTVWEILLATTANGVGSAVALTAALNIVATDAPKDRTASVTGVIFVAKSIGGTFGAQVSGVIITAGTVAGLPSEHAFVNTYTLSAAICFAAVVAALLVGVRPASAPLVSEQPVLNRT
jgi:MFS family permease